MDQKNRFETQTTALLHRGEWLAAELVVTTLIALHLTEINWWLFVALFAVIDMVGYVPGAIAYRRSPDHQISRAYYVLYNTMHSWMTWIAILVVWTLTAGPDWTMLAVPFHLMIDRFMFGNSMKPFGIPFEPHPIPEFRAFESSYTTGRASGRPRWAAEGGVA